MAGRLDPSLLVGSKLLGAQRGDVPQRVGEPLLVAVGREQSFLVGARISDCAGVHQGQGRLGQVLAFDQHARNFYVDALRELRVAEDFSHDSGDLAGSQLVETKYRGRLGLSVLPLRRRVETVVEDGGRDAPDNSVGKHH